MALLLPLNTFVFPPQARTRLHPPRRRRRCSVSAALHHGVRFHRRRGLPLLPQRCSRHPRPLLLQLARPTGCGGSAGMAQCDPARHASGSVRPRTIGVFRSPGQPCRSICVVHTPQISPATSCLYTLNTAPARGGTTNLFTRFNARAHCPRAARSLKTPALRDDAPVSRATISAVGAWPRYGTGTMATFCRSLTMQIIG